MKDTIVEAKSVPKSLKWIARVLGTLYLIFVLAGIPYVLNPDGPEGPPPTSWPSSWGLMILFPFGVAAGILVSWFRPLTGGTAVLICLIVAAVVPDIPLVFGKQALFLTVVALLFICYGVLDIKQRRTHNSI